MSSTLNDTAVEVGAEAAHATPHLAQSSAHNSNGFDNSIGMDGSALTSAGSYVPLTPSSNHYHRYNCNVGKTTGLLQILCGSVTAVMGLLALVLHSHHYFMDLPLWAGLIYLFGGVFGVSTINQQTFMIGLYLLFSTMSSLMAMVVVVVQVNATFMEANLCECSILQSTQMLYDVTAAIVSCMELLMACVAIYHCMLGLGCCMCCQAPPLREPRNSVSHPPSLMDFSNIPLPPAPIYPVLPPDTSVKVPLD